MFKTLMVIFINMLIEVQTPVLFFLIFIIDPFMILPFFSTGHTGSWRIQWEKSKAAEDMGWTTASLLVASLLDHLCSCVFLVSARTVNGTAHIVSSLSNSSVIVSIRDNLSYFH